MKISEAEKPESHESYCWSFKIFNSQRKQWEKVICCVIYFITNIKGPEYGLQLPMDEIATLKVAHATSNLGGHVHEHYSIDLVLVPIP